MTGIAITQPSAGSARKFAAAMLLAIGLVLAIAFAQLAVKANVGTRADSAAPAVLSQDQGYQDQRAGERGSVSAGTPGYLDQRAGERTVGSDADGTDWAVSPLKPH